MGLLSVPSYQDYLAANPQNNGGSEGSGGFTGLSEEAWNKLSDAQKWQNVGSGIALAPSDPRYNDVNQQLGNPGGLLRLGYSAQSNPINSAYYVDPKAVAQDHGVFATNNQNLTPYSQLAKGVPDWFWPVMFAAGVAGGTLAGGAEAGVGEAAAPAGSGSLDMGAYTGAYDAGLNGVGANVGAGSSLGSLDMGAYGAAYDAGLNGVGSNVGNGLAATGAAPVVDNSIPAAGGQSGAPVVDHSVAAGGSSGSSGLLGQAGSWAMSHPLQAAGLLQTAYGLVGGHSGSSSGSSGNGSKGGNGNSGGGNFSIPQRQFYVNPYIAAQIQRGYQ